MRAYRVWRGWRPARRLAVPGFLMALMWRLGDLVAWFGWRPPIPSTAPRGIRGGAVGDAAAGGRGPGPGARRRPPAPRPGRAWDGARRDGRRRRLARGDRHHPAAARRRLG